MIYPSLNVIADQLNNHIYEKWGATINGTAEIVQLNNISNITEEKNDLQNKIILTLIKVEEEATLKNSAFITKVDQTQIRKHHPAVHLNLFLLISITKKSYKEALQLLSDTITFFQSHRVFTGKANQNEKPDFKVIVEQYDINFQELFDMWSNMGNKHFPSVIYKIRLLRLFDSEEFAEMPPIETININYEK